MSNYSGSYGPNRTDRGMPRTAPGDLPLIMRELKRINGTSLRRDILSDDSEFLRVINAIIAAQKAENPFFDEEQARDVIYATYFAMRMAAEPVAEKERKELGKLESQLKSQQRELSEILLNPPREDLRTLYEQALTDRGVLQEQFDRVQRKNYRLTSEVEELRNTIEDYQTAEAIRDAEKHFKDVLAEEGYEDPDSSDKFDPKNPREVRYSGPPI